MAVLAKICGINSPEAMAAAIAGGAAYVGLVFYPPSPRHVTPERAAQLAAAVPEHVAKVGLFVDADDETLQRVLDIVPLDILQLHGSETPQRVADVKKAFGLQVMKALRIAGPDDVAGAAEFATVSDRLLFDAQAPADMAGALPGGNGLAFDWQLLAAKEWPLPWMLSGGLTAETLAEAVAATGAACVDVSSGVEAARGVKDPEKIRQFLAVAASL
ncbi:MAG: phosphoribosylanthranilate isomerase [Reyranellaceae bacterium]